jgi:hypothetical protein
VQIKPILLAIAIMATAFLSTGCHRSKPQAEVKPIFIDLAKVRPGPVRRENLSEEQMGRIAKLQSTFSEVDPSPIEKWMDDFKRDQNPDGEIAVWESIAAAFEKFTSSKDLSLSAKKEAFGLLLQRSGTTEEAVIQHAKPVSLSLEDVRQIMSFYTAAPTPVLVAPTSSVPSR